MHQWARSAGYLTTGAADDPAAAAGGAALLDLAAALSWLRRNVAAFGGDPRRVTLAGHAAGAALANALLMTPHAKGSSADTTQFPLAHTHPHTSLYEWNVCRSRVPRAADERFSAEPLCTGAGRGTGARAHGAGAALHARFLHRGALVSAKRSYSFRAVSTRD